MLFDFITYCTILQAGGSGGGCDDPNAAAQVGLFFRGGGASPCCKLYTQYTYMNTHSRIHGNTCARTHATHARTHTSTKTNKHSHTHKERKRACARALSLSHTHTQRHAAQTTRTRSQRAHMLPVKRKPVERNYYFYINYYFHRTRTRRFRAHMLCVKGKKLFLYKLLFPENEDAPLSRAYAVCQGKDATYTPSTN